MDYDYTVFYTHLKNLIDAHGQTLRDAADELGISAATLSRYISGLRVPDLSYVIRIATYYNVPLSWLLGMSDSRYDVIPDNLKALLSKYQQASARDREIVDFVLANYKEE